MFYETLFASVAVFMIVGAFILSAIFSEENTLIITLFAFAFIIGGYHKAKEGLFDTLKEKRLNVEFLMIIAALSAFLIGNYSEGAILILIFSISGVLETYANAKSEKALKSLLNLAPETAILYQDGIEKEVSLSEVKEHDHLIVKVGQKVPVDSVILEGDTAVDQAAITGEFVPAYKHKGDIVYAGAINIESSVIIKAVKNAKDSVIQKIVSFVETAQNDHPQSESRIKVFERYYVYVVIAFALMMMFIPPLFNWLTFEESFYRGIIVLVVGSPCALVASVSPAVLAALSNASKKHILIKGGSRLEGLSEVNAVIFDKTGTVTTGEPKVVEIVHEQEDLQTIKQVLFTLEQQSNHPLARAIVKHLNNDANALSEISTKERPGYGMEATLKNDEWKVGRFDYEASDTLKTKLNASMDKGQTNVYVIKNKQLVAYVALKDTLRDGVKEMIQALKLRNIHTIMMTGDTEKTALALAETIGIDTLHAECFPQTKVDIVKQSQIDYGKVLMIGDGINDAPALTQSDVAIAMGTGTDVSLETSDIVFIDDNLSNLEKVFKIASRLQGIIRLNITVSVLVIVFLMIGNIFGQIQLPFGVLMHELSTIGVILNSLRLLIK